MQTIQENVIRQCKVQLQSFRFHLLGELKKGGKDEGRFALFHTGTDITLSFHHGFLAIWLFQSADTGIIYS